MRALLPLNARVMDIDLVRREILVRLRLAVAMRARLPLNADVMLRGLVLRGLVLRGLVLRGLVLRGLVLRGLVLRDVAVPLGPVYAVLVVTEPPELINIVHGGSVPLEGPAASHCITAKLGASAK